MGSRYCIRNHTTLGYPNVLWRSIGCFLCYQRRIQTEYAGTNHRMVLKTNMANSATGWLYRHVNNISNGKSNFKYLYRTSISSYYGRLLRRLSRSRRVSLRIASRIHSITVFLEKQLKKCGYTQVNAQYFDTLRFLELPEHVSAQQIRTIALTKEVNLRYYETAMLVSALTKQQMWQLPMCCSRFLPLPPEKITRK